MFFRLPDSIVAFGKCRQGRTAYGGDAKDSAAGRGTLQSDHSHLLEQVGEIAADEAGKNSEPLGWGLRFVILFLGMIVGIPLALYYSIKGGHRRKVKESLLWTIFCFLFWMGLEMLRAVLKDVHHT